MSIDRLDDYIEGLDNQYIDKLLKYEDSDNLDSEYDFEVENEKELRDKKSSLIKIYKLLDAMVDNIELEIDKVIESESKNKRVNHTEAEELIEISSLISQITKRKE
jgi:hypothetical protein